MSSLLNTPAARQSLQLLRDLIEERTGNFFSDPNLPLLALKLENRLAELGLLTYLDYYYLLRYDPHSDEEWRQLETAITVNETYFWRESEAIQAVAQKLAPERRPGQTLRIWHAACASGEEPYSMVLALLEAGLFAWRDIEVMATDLDRRVLEAARQAIYRQRSVRLLPRNWLERHFEELPQERWALRPAVAGRVSLRRLNLVEEAEFARMPKCDFIFCRNVMLYFKEERIPRLIERLVSALAPGGCLFVGTSESLLRFAPALEFGECGGSVFYRKPDHG
ncbi:protein-glutamate O-methyltransferase CheR [bacterium]|nr:protein-glutamate O-methyltransferase CheR [bacterium]